MPRARFLLVSAVLAAVLASAPAAGATSDLPVQSGISPASKATVTAGLGTLTFTVPTACAGLSAYIDVSTDVQYDPDGTLLGTTTVDRITLDETAAGTYTGTSNGDWLNQPGGYYWQINGLGTCGTGTLGLWVGPTIGIVVKGTVAGGGGDGTVIPDDPEVLTLDQARAAIPLAIKGAHKKVARSLRRSCRRDTSGDLGAVACRASWNERTVLYTGEFTLVLDDTGDIVTRFDGKRATTACIKRRKKIGGTKKCYRAHHFSRTI